MSDNHEKKWADMPLQGREPQAVLPEEPKNRGLWAAFAVLLLALIGVATYGYLALDKENIQLSQVPEVTESVKLVSGRMAAAEARLREMSFDWQALQQSFADLDKKVNSRTAATRKYAEKLNAQLESRLRNRMDDRATALEARIRELQSQQQTDRARLAQLRNELAGVQSELAAVRHQAGQNFDGLSQRVAANEQQLTELDQDLDAERVDFEVVKKRQHELAPEISLEITKTDVPYQRFSGWIRYAPDGRTLWVRDQGVQQPVTFYTRQGDEMYELVVTRVAKDSAVGYLLLPMADGSDLRQSKLTDQNRPGVSRGF
jgi:predicted  nucleic acid-binding Zn-ribbon protein